MNYRFHPPRPCSGPEVRRFLSERAKAQGIEVGDFQPRRAV